MDQRGVGRRDRHRAVGDHARTPHQHRRRHRLDNPGRRPHRGGHRRGRDPGPVPGHRRRRQHQRLGPHRGTAHRRGNRPHRPHRPTTSHHHRHRRHHRPARQRHRRHCSTGSWSWNTAWPRQSRPGWWPCTMRCSSRARSGGHRLRQGPPAARHGSLAAWRLLGAGAMLAVCALPLGAAQPALSMAVAILGFVLIGAGVGAAGHIAAGSARLGRCPPSAGGGCGAHVDHDGHGHPCFRARHCRARCSNRSHGRG